MTKKILLKSSLFAISLGILTGCGELGKENTNQTPQTNNQINNQNEAKSVQTLQAVTGIKMVDTIASVSKLNAKSFRENVSNKDLDKEINEILPQLDLLLSSGNLITSQVSNVQTTINNETFEIQEVITYKDSSLNDVTYKLVYNSKAFENRDDDEVEKNYLLNGYVIIDENLTYKFESKSSEETDRDEYESERNFKISLNDRSYVFVEESYEEEGTQKEREFEYTFINNGYKEIEYSIEIENERFDDEIEFEIQNQEFKVEKFSQNGKEFYKVLVKERNQFVDFRVYEKVIYQDGSISFVEFK